MTRKSKRRLVPAKKNRLLRKRLALRLKVDSDQSDIFQPLLDMMERQRLDFHGTFRMLAGFRRGIVKDESGEGTAAGRRRVGGVYWQVASGDAGARSTGSCADDGGMVAMARKIRRPDRQ